MSLLLLLNPKQYGGVVPPQPIIDKSDILKRRSYRKKQEEQELEEAIAAQLLKAKQEDIVIPEAVNPIRLGTILERKMYQKAQPDEVHGEVRKKRIKMLLMALLMDDL